MFIWRISVAENQRRETSVLWFVETITLSQTNACGGPFVETRVDTSQSYKILRRIRLEGTNRRRGERGNRERKKKNGWKREGSKDSAGRFLLAIRTSFSARGERRTLKIIGVHGTKLDRNERENDGKDKRNRKRK